MSARLFSTRLPVSLRIGVRSAAVAFVVLGTLYSCDNSYDLVHSSPKELGAMVFCTIPPLAFVAGTIGLFITFMCSLVHRAFRKNRAETTGDDRFRPTQKRRTSLGPRAIVSVLLGGSFALCIGLIDEIADPLVAAGRALGIDALLVFICVVLIFAFAFFILLSLLSQYRSTGANLK